MIEDKQDRGLHRLAKWLLGDRRSSASTRDVTASLYRQIVTAARQPLFYAEWGVPDTTDGRREMIGLQAILVMRRLRAGGSDGARLTQALCDLMFADIDRNLREQGVGDLSVGKHVKRAASTFLARYKAVDQALDSHDQDLLGTILQRNLFTTGTQPNDQKLQVLVAYLRAVDFRLAAVPVDRLIDGSHPLNELHAGTDTKAPVGKIIDPSR